MNKKIIYIILFVFFIIWNLCGLNWGLMSKEKINLIEPGIQNIGEFYNDLINSRDKIYEQEKQIYVSYGKLTASERSRIREELFNSIYIVNYKKSLDLETFYTAARPFYTRTYHSDEQANLVAISNMNPKELDFNPKFFQYGGAHIYSYAFLLFLGKIFNFVQIIPGLKFYLKNPGEMAKMYIIGRILVFLVNMAMIYLIYIFLKKHINNIFLIILLIIYTTNPLITLYKSVVKPYLLGAFFILLSLFIFNYFLINRRRIYLILTGIVLGFAGGSIILSFSACVVPMFFLIFLSQMSMKEKIYNSLLLGLSVFIGFFITNPYFILTFSKSIYEFKKVASANYTLNLFNIIIGLKNYIVLIFLKSLGILGIICIYVFYNFFRKKQTIKKTEKNIYNLIISTGVFLFIYNIYLIQICYFNKLSYTRLSITMIPAIIIVIGLIFKYLEKNSKRIITALLILGIIANLFVSVQYQMDFLKDSSTYSTRVKAGEWINKNINKGSSIGMVKVPQPDYTPYFSFAEYDLHIYPSQEYNKKLEIKSDYFIYVDRFEDKKYLNGLIKKKYKIIKKFQSKRIYYKILLMLNPDIYIFKKGVS